MARPAPGADRSVAVLELLASHPDERFTLSEVARRCGLNKATAHALLSALTAHGILLRHPEEKRYSLGPRLIAIGEAAHRGYTAIDFAPYVLRRLAEDTGLAAAAAKLEDDAVWVIARAGQDVADDVPPPRLPAIPPLGALFMAWSDEPTTEAWLARAPASEVVGHVLEALPVIRDRGYAISRATPEWHRLVRSSARGLSHDEVRALLADLGRHGALITALDAEDTYPVANVAAPVFRADGGVELAVMAMAPAGTEGGVTRTGAEIEQLGARVVAAAQELTFAVHGRRPLWSSD
ncbi:MAG TPA: helix-turn-helix domain-containing protein [Acidimicrobiales bacterium]